MPRIMNMKPNTSTASKTSSGMKSIGSSSRATTINTKSMGTRSIGTRSMGTRSMGTRSMGTRGSYKSKSISKLIDEFSDSDNDHESDGDDDNSDDSDYESKTFKSAYERESLDSIQITREFQENVVRYVKFDDLVKRKNIELAELKAQRKPCEAYILKYLDENKETVITITDGKLKKNKAETKKALTQDVIKSAIAAKVADPAMVEEILKLMEDKRPMNTHVNLKRVRNSKNVSFLVNQ